MALATGRVYTTIAEAVAQVAKIPVSDLTPQTRIDQLNLDSLGLLEVMLQCEEALDIDIVSEEVPPFETLGDAAKHLEARL